MELPDWIGQVFLGGGGGAAIALGLFRFLGQNWIKNKLNKDLETAKAEISIHAAKRLRLQDKEYEVFPEIWARLSDSKASLQAALIQFRPMPDLDRMSQEDFESWLDSAGLDEKEKRALKSSTDRNSEFERILDYRALRKANEKYFEFQTYFEKNRIFLSPEVRETFDEIKGPLRKSWAAKKADIDLADRAGGEDYLSKAMGVYKDEVEPLMAELEEIVQRRLFPDQVDKKQ